MPNCFPRTELVITPYKNARDFLRIPKNVPIIAPPVDIETIKGKHVLLCGATLPLYLMVQAASIIEETFNTSPLLYGKDLVIPNNAKPEKWGFYYITEVKI